MPAQSHLTNDCGCQFSRIGTPTLAAVVVLAVLGLGVICWIINSPDRCDRVNRMLLARRGDTSHVGAQQGQPSCAWGRKRNQSRSACSMKLPIARTPTSSIGPVAAAWAEAAQQSADRGPVHPRCRLANRTRHRGEAALAEMLGLGQRNPSATSAENRMITAIFRL